MVGLAPHFHCLDDLRSLKYDTAPYQNKLYIFKVVTKPLPLYEKWNLDTALRDHMRIVFEDMSSWTALTMYIQMKTTF